MNIDNLNIEGLKLITLDVFSDSRGFFVEHFNYDRFGKDLSSSWVQDNKSRSYPNVLRGLHFQTNPWQGKLVGVTRGTIWDVAVDIRKNSPTFGKYYSVELSDENQKLLYIPEGFAHGFCVLGKHEADVFYKTTSLYNSKSDGGIHYSDPILNISWPIQNPIVSEKDQRLPYFNDLF